jgi:hypothetical protein
MTDVNQPIHAEMTVPEIVSHYPETQGVFERHGIRRDGYKALEYETLFATAKVHQLALDALLAELNGTITR